MGVVYGAEQIEPVQRKVALKRIRRSLHDRLIEACFKVERPALAAMDHRKGGLRAHRDSGGRCAQPRVTAPPLSRRR